MSPPESSRDEDLEDELDMVLLESTEDLRAFAPPPETPQAGSDEGDDAGFSDVAPLESPASFSDEAPLGAAMRRATGGESDPDNELPDPGTARFSDEAPLAPPPRRPPPSGRRPRPRRASETSSRVPRPRRGPPPSGRRPRPRSGASRRPSGRLGRRPPPGGGKLGETSRRIPRPPAQSDRLPPESRQAQRPAPYRDPELERISSQRLGRPGPSDTSPRSEDVKQAALEKLQRRIQPPPANDPYVGRELGPFKVEEYLGGDRGERRYLALHEEQKVFAYLRVFPLTGSYGDEFKRLAGRGERACRVDHAHLEACLGAGRTKEAFFVGTEPPYGETLAEVIVREGPLGEDAALELLEQALGGLRTLHARDYAHAHISPLTIRREAPGRWVLCETGLARSRAAFSFLAAGGDVVGYPGYVAPETVDSGKPTKESDLYSLGCALWCALRGTPPFTGDDEVQILLDQLNREVPSLSEGLPETGGPEFSQGLVTILGKLTGYTPNVRYGSAGDVASDLRALKKGDPVAPFPSELAQQDDEPEGKAVSTGSTLALVLLLANALLAAWLGLTWLGSRQLQAVDPFEGFSFPLEADSEGEGE